METRLVSSFLTRLQGKTIQLSSFADVLKVSTAEFKMDFTTRHYGTPSPVMEGVNKTLPREAKPEAERGGSARGV